jgi:hypothetical protein
MVTQACRKDTVVWANRHEVLCQQQRSVLTGQTNPERVYAI